MMEFSPEMNILPPIIREMKEISYFNKFKKYAKSIQTQTKLIQNIAEVNETKFAQSKASRRRQSTQPCFNVNAFKSHVTPSGAVGSSAKIHLLKLPWERTEADLKIIFSIVNGLKSFSRYPSTVREQLCKALYYECFENGRVVVRQGDTGYSLYFILSGGVSVEVSEKDQVTGQNINQIVDEMYAGDMFGEVSLLHNVKRTATIVCKGQTEFLRIDKTDFDMVLKTSYEKEYNSRLDFLRSLPELEDFTERELQQLMAKCRFVQYAHNKVLQNGKTDKDEFHEYVQFIRSGRCHVIKELKIITRSIPFQRPRLIFLPQKTSKTFKMTKFDTIKPYFLGVRVLKEGDYFGAGEEYTSTSIATIGRVEIVQIPRKTLQNRKHGLLLTFMRDRVMELFPSSIDVFRCFEKEKSWEEYKRQTVLRSVQNKRNQIFMPSFEDVPLSIRNFNSDYLEHYNVNLPNI